MTFWGGKIAVLPGRQ